MKRMMVGLLFLTVAADAFAYYVPEQGRWLSRDPIEERGGKNLYRALNNNPVNLVDPFGRSVYMIVIPSGIPLVDHRMIVGDDGKGGSYVIDFSPRRGGCNRICGPGAFGFSHIRNETPAKNIASMPGAQVVQWVLTTESVDGQLLQDAKDWYENGVPPSFLVGFRDCNRFAWEWLKWARFLNDMSFEIPVPQ